MTTWKPERIGRLRLIAQGLTEARAENPLEVVQWLTCLQAQDFRAARSAVALRAGGTVADVDAAIDAGELVRSWPMRGTLHLVPAAELRWMLAINAEPILRSGRRRHEQLQITPRDIDHAASVTDDALRGGGGLARAETFDLWERHGIATSGQRGIHLLQALCLRAHLVLGPMAGKHQQFVLYDEWIPSSEPVDRPANIADWALRYFRSHGPATIADFRWWSGVLHRDLAPVWDDVRAHLEEIVVDGTSYLLAPETLEQWPGKRTATLRPLLTPAFDEILLGYADRTPTLDRAHLDLVVPGGNGMFKAVLIDGARGVATWRRGPAKAPLDIEVSPFRDALSKRAQRALPRLAKCYPFAR
ncbi:winged helix DNA-binding domain-containing protein [Flexivirga sp. B27]